MRKYRLSNLLKSGSFLLIFANFCKFLRISVIFCKFLPPISTQLAHLIENRAPELTRELPVFAA
jgi:hypothetical protein